MNDQKPDGRLSLGTVGELLLTVALTVLVLLINVAMGHVRFGPIVLASLVVLGSTGLGAGLAYRIINRAVNKSSVPRSDFDEMRRMFDEMRRALDSMSSDLARFNRALPSYLLTDEQFSRIESDPTTTGVLICKENMGSEFDPDLNRRDSIITYERVVRNNIARGVHYQWIAPDNETTRYRQNIIYGRFPPPAPVRITLLSERQWLNLSLTLEVVFIFSISEGSWHPEGFLLAPLSDDPLERFWIRMKPDLRAQFLGRAMDYIDRDFLA